LYNYTKWQCCCQGLETQGRGQDKESSFKDKDKDKGLSKDEDEDLKIGPRGSSRTRTFLEDNNTAKWPNISKYLIDDAA